MKTTNTKIEILNRSTINVIAQLLKFEGFTNGNEVWFKKTAISFKKKYGFELKDAPIIFKKDGCIWKLSHIKSNYSPKNGGRRFEIADYLPIVSVGNKFDRLLIK